MTRLLSALTIVALAAIIVSCSAPGVSDQPTQWGNAVSIDGGTFSPLNLQTTVNTEVKFANNDTMAHHLVADDGSFDSVVEEGRTFRHTFTKAGTYPYRCATHGETGTVIVE